MSSIESRTSPATGLESHRVRWRTPAGTNAARTFPTLADAERWRSVLDTIGSDAALKLLAPAPVTQTVTVADLVRHHIDHLTGKDEGTVRRYRTILRDHLEPRFGRIAAAELTRADVALWVKEARLLNGKEPAPKTLRNWHSLLSDALSSAVRDEQLVRNVAKGVSLPKREHLADDDMVFLTYSDAGALLAATPEQWRPLVLTLLLTGIRWGEATALTVSALSPATNSARIHTAWKQSGKTGGPKSRRSRRTVVVPPEVFAALAPLTAGKAPGDLVFTATRGGRVRSGNFWNNVWSKVVDEVAPVIGKRPRVHDLRHTFASWAIQKGHQLPVIQRQMGHESIQTTIDLYGHLARADFDPLLSLGSGLSLPSARPAEVEASPAPLAPPRS